MTSCAENAPGPLKGHMRTMAGLDNIPRKEKQFRNFTANSLNLRGKNGDTIVGEIWNVLKQERERRQAEKEAQQKADEEQSRKEEEKRTEEQKSRGDHEAIEKPSNDKSSIVDVKKVKKAMKKELKKAPNRSMKLKELRKLLGEKLGLPKAAKKQLKKLLEDAPELSTKTKVKVDGKLIMLV